MINLTFDSTTAVVTCGGCRQRWHVLPEEPFIGTLRTLLLSHECPAELEVPAPRSRHLQLAEPPQW